MSNTEKNYLPTPQATLDSPENFSYRKTMAKYTKAHGWYININIPTKNPSEFMKEFLKLADNAKEKHQVTVKIFGQEKHFTLYDFCKRLGIRPE